MRYGRKPLFRGKHRDIRLLSGRTKSSAGQRRSGEPGGTRPYQEIINAPEQFNAHKIESSQHSIQLIGFNHTYNDYRKSTAGTGNGGYKEALEGARQEVAFLQLQNARLLDLLQKLVNRTPNCFSAKGVDAVPADSKGNGL